MRGIRSDVTQVGVAARVDCSGNGRCQLASCVVLELDWDHQHGLEQVSAESCWQECGQEQGTHEKRTQVVLLSLGQSRLGRLEQGFRLGGGKSVSKKKITPSHVPVLQPKLKVMEIDTILC